MKQNCKNRKQTNEEKKPIDEWKNNKCSAISVDRCMCLVFGVSNFFDHAKKKKTQAQAKQKLKRSGINSDHQIEDNKKTQKQRKKR